MKSIVVTNVSKILSISGHVELHKDTGNTPVTELQMLSVGDVLIFSDNAILSIEHLDGTIAQLPSLELELADDQVDAEIASLQSLIASGEDPTQVAEASAAGISISGNSGGFGFTSVERNAKEVIAQAGYDTTELNQRPAAASFEKTTNYSLSSPSAPQSPKDKNDSKVNKLPNAVNDQVKVDEDGRITLDLTKNDNDADGSFKITAIASIELTGKEQIISIDNGQIEISAEGNIVFVPDTNFNGDVSFDYTITDDDGASATATVAITVKPVNDAPEFIDDNNNPASGNITAETEEDIPVSGQLMATDADGDELNFALADDSLPSNGLVNVNKDGSWEYTPTTDFNGEDSFDVIVNDGKGGTDTITVNITVKPANVDPVIVDNNGAPLGDSITVTTDEDVKVGGKLSATDADGDTLTFTQSTDPKDGTVTVDANGNWTYDPNTNFNGDDSFTVTVSDGKGGTDTISVNITVNPINDAPVLVDANNQPLGESIAVTTDEEVKVGGKLSATDADGDTLTFTQSTDPKDGKVTVDSNGNWAYDPNPDFHGNDSFTVTVSDGKGGTDTITVNITVNPANDNPVIVDNNGAPLGESIAVTTDEEVKVGGKLSATDADGDELTFTQSSDPKNGTVTVDANGNWTYDPNTNFNGDDSFTVTVSDGKGGTDTITVNITVNPANDNPVIVDNNGAPLGDSITVTTDEEVTVGGKLSATDADGDELTFTQSTDPKDGKVTVDSNGNWTYDPNPDFHGSDSFTVTVSDGKGGTDTITVNITVNPANDNPVIVDNNGAPLGDSIAVTTDEEVKVGGKLSATDADGDELTFTQSSDPKNGTVTVDANGNWTYDPNTNFNGDDSFTVTVSDGKGGTDTISVNITVNPINDAPVLVDANNQPLGESIAVTTYEEVKVGGKLSATDADGDTLTFTQSTDPKDGKVTVDSNGNWAYDPNPDFHGNDSFTVTVSDGKGGTDTITVNITVNPANDNPVIVDNNGAPLGESIAVTTDEEVKVGGKLSATDADGDELTFTQSSDPKNGTVTVDANGNWTYDPNTNFNGDDSFTVTVSDGKGGTDTITVNITVTPINDNPVIVDNSENKTPLGDSITVTTDEEVTVGGKLSATDADGDALTFTQSTDPKDGKVTVDSNGNWTYDPNPDFHGNDKFDVIVSDGKGGTDTITVNITVNPVNDAPVLVYANNQPLGDSIAVTTDEDVKVSGKLSATDADGDELTFTQSTDPKDGKVTVDSNGNWTYDPTPDFHGNDKFDVIVSDGKGGTDTITVNITVNPVNDAPVLVDANNQPLGESIAVTTDEEVKVGGKLSATDADGDELTFTQSSDPKNGTVTVDANGNWTYDPNTNFNGDDSFTVTVSDGKGGTDTITVNITVNPANDNPVIVDNSENKTPLGDSITVTTDEEVTVGGKLSATDADGDTLTFTQSSDPKNGTVTVDANGNWAYTPNTSFNGDDSFTVTVNDGKGGTDTITVNITVNPVNDAPVLVDANNQPLGESIAVTTDEEVKVGGKLSATDADGDELTFTQSSDPKNGTVTVDANGNWTYDPNPDFHGNDKFDVIVSDGKGGTDTITVNITVNPANDNPVIVDNNGAPLGESIVVTTDEEVKVGGKLSATDADGDTLTFTQSTDPKDGKVTVDSNGNWTYDPTPDFHGNDKFDVIVSDGKGGTDTITVNITVNPINDAPVIVDNNGAPLGESIVVTTDEEVKVGGKLSATDADGDTLTFTQSTDPKDGKVTVDSNGNWTYDPNTNFNGDDSFTVTVSDGKGGTDTITVNITVNPINDAPVIVDNSENKTPLGDSIAVTTDEDVKVSGKLSATDADGDTLTFTQSTDPKDGKVTVDSNGNWTYDPNPDFHGNDKFDVIVSDGKGGTDTITVNITVNPINDNPVIVDNSENKTPLGDSIAVTTDEDVKVSGKLSATDADGDTLTFTQSTDPKDGKVTVDSNGNWTYDPNPDFHGNDKFDVIVSDGKGGTDTITVNITVNPINDAPVIVDNNGAPLGESIVVTTDEEVKVGGKLSATDADGDELTFTQSSDPKNGTVTVDANGNWTYDPNTNFNGDDSFTVTVSDGKGGTDIITVNITVNPINDSPVIVDNSENKTPLGDSITVTTDEEVTVGGKLSATDADGDTLTFTQSTDPKDGKVTVDSNGNWTYDPNPDFHGNDKFDVIVSDGKGGTDTITINVVVIAVADPILVSVNISSEPIYSSGGKYEDGKDYIDWGTVEKEYGDNAKTLTDTTDDPFKNTLDTGSYAYRGMEGSDSIRITSQGDNVLVGEDGIIGNSTIDGSPMTGLVNDTLTAGAGNDILMGEQGDDSLYGAAGVDTAVYAGNFADYDITKPIETPGSSIFFEVTDKRITSGENVYAREGSDDLYNIERLQFADGTYYWDGGSWVKEQPTYTYSIDINVRLTDLDGSETITQIVLSGLPQGSVLSGLPDGVQIYDADANVINAVGADGVIVLTRESGLWNASDTQVSLSGVQIKVPAELANDIELKVTTTGEESSNQSQSSGFDSVTIDPSINVVSGTETDNNLQGKIGLDILKGLSGNDALFGSDGNDTLNGGEGNDLLIGGQGNDVLIGGSGVDTFAWDLSESINDIDTIQDFNLTEDKLNLSDLLKDATAETLDDYLSISQNGEDSVISIKTNTEDSVNIILENIDSGNLKNNFGIITNNLINNDNGKIILDDQLSNNIPIDKPMVIQSQQEETNG